MGEENKSKVYILADADGMIYRCEGGYTMPEDLIGWIQIDEGEGDRYNLCQTHYFPGGLFTGDGIPLYLWDGERIVHRTEAEIEADRAALPEPEPSELERLRADVDYVMVMEGLL